MRVDKPVLNNQAYTNETIDHIPRLEQQRDINPPASKFSINVTIFFTRDSPLSNFHYAEFEIDDTEYSSVEQYLCYHKAKLFDSQE